MRNETSGEGTGTRRTGLDAEPLTFLSRERAFLDAARQFAAGARRSRRSALEKAVRQAPFSHETACTGIQVLEALVGVQPGPVGADLELVSRRAGLSAEEVQDGLACLRRTRIVAPDSHAIEWQRFGAAHFDAALSRRVLAVWEALPEDLDFFDDTHGWVRGSMVLLRIASFGRCADGRGDGRADERTDRGAGLTLDNLALLSRHGVEAARLALARLRDHGLVRRRSLEIRLEGLARLESASRR
ncbi:hypothetical protein [Novosphingobium sp. 9]|uniref:hypothetical protein n=1 Tax=Novosphingobium sp. 9 TaxID=2025349 RepID=UPI0021B55F6A|nr:hypothetical protein [Novosphingobium sp. 9]